MAVIRHKELGKMGEKERTEKLKELQIELIKSKVAASKSGKAKIREIRKTIARILTLAKK